MKRTGRRDTAPELALRSELHKRGLRYRVDHRPEPDLRTRADVVFPRARVVVFVDGCFWHACPEHGTAPKSNSAWWAEKLRTNVARDQRGTRELTELGWTVVRAWAHEDMREVADRVEELIRRRSSK
jgi:DNA mismatch endonuclease, patch repair protein